MRMIQKKLSLFLRKITAARMLRFFAVGFSGIFINSAVLAIAVEIFYIHYLAGAVIATQGSTLWNYTWTEWWVFRDGRNARAGWQRIGSFFLMNNVFLLFRAPLLALFTEGIEINYLFANLASILILAAVRFFLSDRWIWRKVQEKDNYISEFYNIHDILRVASTTRLPELEYFRVEALNAPPDITVTNRKKSRVPQHPEAIRYDEGLGDIGFWLEIHPGDVTKVYVSPMLRRSPHVLYTNVVEPLLRWAFVRKDFALVHGACLSFQKQGLMVTAGTDTGKTTTILKSLDNYPFDFVSDDMVIMGRDGSMRTYPKPLTISLHTMRAVKKSNLTFMERLKLQFQSRLHSRLGRRIGMFFGNIDLPAATLNAYVQMLVPPPKFMIDRLVPTAALETQTELKFVVVIERGEIKEEILPAEDISRIVHTNIEDAYGFPPYPILADQLSCHNGQDLKIVERGIIDQVIRNLPAVYLRRADFNWWQRIPAVFYGDSFGVKNPISALYPTIPRERGADSK